jgi:hypothetical protein
VRRGRQSPSEPDAEERIAIVDEPTAAAEEPVRDADQRAFAVDFERFEEPTAPVTPTADLNDRSLIPRQLVIDAGRVRNDIAGEAHEQLRRHAAVVLRGVAKQHGSSSSRARLSSFRLRTSTR